MDMRIENISVYGCGGTGSHILNGLARIDHALKSLNKFTFQVTAYDPDTVTEQNVGRQAFYPCDVGVNKAKVLCERINLYYHTRWRAVPSKAPSSDKTDLFIACVDTVKSREAIAKSWHKKGTYMIDCGNAKSSGQVLLGQFNGKLPNLYTENDELIYGDEPEDDFSCTDQYYRQDLFVNNAVALQALQIVWSMVRWGKINHRGVFLDIERGAMNPIKIEEDII
jgi:PRTRC genetic system ThiF family protein